MENNDILKEIELNINEQIKDGINEAIENATVQNIKISITIKAQ